MIGRLAADWATGGPVALWASGPECGQVWGGARNGGTPGGRGRTGGGSAESRFETNFGPILGQFWVIWGNFEPIFGPFGPGNCGPEPQLGGAIAGQVWASPAHGWGQCAHTAGQLCALLNVFGLILGQFWANFKHSGLILDNFEPILDAFWTHFGPILDPFWIHFGHISNSFYFKISLIDVSPHSVRQLLRVVAQLLRVIALPEWFASFPKWFCSISEQLQLVIDKPFPSSLQIPLVLAQLQPRAITMVSSCNANLVELCGINWALDR